MLLGTWIIYRQKSVDSMDSIDSNDGSFNGEHTPVNRGNIKFTRSYKYIVSRMVVTNVSQIFYSYVLFNDFIYIPKKSLAVFLSPHLLKYPFCYFSYHI